MTKRDRKTLCAYLRRVADTMELRDWRFELMRAPADEGDYATVKPVFGQKHAIIWVCKNFRELDPARQREIICHELIHCHLAPLQSQLEQDLDGELGRTSETVFFRSFLRNLEYAVNGLEFALAKHLPLIEWPS